jgi:WD40 repeat protein
LVRLQVEKGIRLMQDGDGPGSLVWFAEALRLDAGEPAREEMHRLRLASVLRQCPRPIQIWFHEENVNHAEFSPDGRRVVIASGNVSRRDPEKSSTEGAARVWDVATGEPVTPLLQHRGPVVHAAFSPDGRRVLTAGGDAIAQVWDAATGQSLLSLKHGGFVRFATFSSDGRRVVTTSGDFGVRVKGGARIWDAATGELLTTLVHDQSVQKAWLSPDGSRALTLGRTVQLWDAGTGKLVRIVQGDESGGQSHAAFSPDGRRVMSDGPTARVWDAATGNPVTTLPLQHSMHVNHVVFSPDGQHVATSSWDQTARVWEAATGKPVTDWLRHGGSVIHAAFSPDGRRLVTASYDGKARVWEVATGEPLTPPLCHGGPGRSGLLRSAAFSPDGRQVLTVSRDQVRVWDVASGEVVTPSLSHGAVVTQARFSPDGRRVITSGGGRAARLWDAGTGQLLTGLAHSGWVYDAAFSPDGRLVVTGNSKPVRTADGKSSFAGEAQVWDAATGQRSAAPLPHKSPVMRAAFSPDARRVVTISRPRGREATAASEVQVWEVATGQPVTPPLQPGIPVSDIAFSPDGRLLVSAGQQLSHVWEVATGKTLLTLRQVSRVNQVSFSPDGRRVLTASWNYRARVWDVATGEALLTLEHGSFVNAATFSPDGRRILTASHDATAQIWDAATGEPLTPPLKHDHVVTQAWFSADGRKVLTASWDRTVRVWDAATGDPLGLPLRHGAEVAHAVFSPDGRRALTALGQGTSAAEERRAARLWDLSPDDRPVEELVQLAHFLAGRRIAASGGFVALEVDQVRTAWQALRSKYPADFTCSPAQARAWHEREAATCERAGLLSAALQHFDALINVEPDNWRWRDRRGRVHGELGRWEKAAADFAQAMERGANSPWIGYVGALCCLAGGDPKGYRQACAKQVERFGATEGTGLNTVAWNCLLAPDALTDRTLPVRLAEKVLAGTAANDRNRYLYLNTLGAAHYRAGQLDRAVDRLQEAIQAQGKGGTAWDWLFLAMAHQRRGNAEEARKLLEKAARWIDEALQKQPERAGANPPLTLDQRLEQQRLTWDQRLELSLLRREAEAVIKGPQTPDDPKK